MNEILVMGSSLSDYPTKINGAHSTINKNSNGSWTFSSTATDSNAYGYYIIQPRQGETIEFTVLACALGDTKPDGSDAPMLALRWVKGNGSWKVSSENYVTSEFIRTYKVTLTINDPVGVGDYVEASFGHFKPSMISGVFFNAKLTICNSALPCKRVLFASTLQIGASDVNTNPALTYLSQFNQMNLNSVTWKDHSTLTFQDDRLKLPVADANSWYVNCRLLMDSAGDYRKLHIYHGMYDWTEGAFSLTFIDTSTHNGYDFYTQANGKVVCQFEGYTV